MEQLMGLSPDGGTGLYEVALLIGLGVTFWRVAVRRGIRRR